MGGGATAGPAGAPAGICGGVIPRDGVMVPGTTPAGGVTPLGGVPELAGAPTPPGAPGTGGCGTGDDVKEAPAPPPVNGDGGRDVGKDVGKAEPKAPGIGDARPPTVPGGEGTVVLEYEAAAALGGVSSLLDTDAKEKEENARSGITDRDVREDLTNSFAGHKHRTKLIKEESVLLLFSFVTTLPLKKARSSAVEQTVA